MKSKIKQLLTNKRVIGGLVAAIAIAAGITIGPEHVEIIISAITSVFN